MATIEYQLNDLVKMELPYGTIVRAGSAIFDQNQRITALVLQDGSIRMLRDGNKTPSILKKGQKMGGYPNFATLVQVLNPSWTIDIKKPLTAEEKKAEAEKKMKEWKNMRQLLQDMPAIKTIATPGKVFKMVDKKFKPGTTITAYITNDSSVLLLAYNGSPCTVFARQYEYPTVYQFCDLYGLTLADFEPPKPQVPQVKECGLHAPMQSGGLCHSANSSGYSMYSPPCNGCEMGIADQKKGLWMSGFGGNGAGLTATATSC